MTLTNKQTRLFSELDRLVNNTDCDRIDALSDKLTHGHDAEMIGSAPSQARPPHTHNRDELLTDLDNLVNTLNHTRLSALSDKLTHDHDHDVD